MESPTCVCSELQQARQEARERALDAAREAVERASSLFQPLGPALAAIDALREEQKAAHTPPSW